MSLPKINRTGLPAAKEAPEKNQEPASLFERAYQLLQPLIVPSLALVPEAEFSTRTFVTYLRASNPGEDAYTEAVSGWQDNFTLGRQTIHGQILPQLLKEAGATWVSYSYNPADDDGLSVPSLWLKPGYKYQDED